MKVTNKITITNEDNMALMSGYPDKYFDLAIVDPPYGIGEDGGDKQRNFRSKKCPKGTNKHYNKKNWDNSIPNENYFIELKRITKNQIIWGGNYFVDYLDSSMGWIFWDKKNGESDFSDGELAYTSFKKALRKFEWLWAGFQKQRPEIRIHPTQKPVALYKWLLKNYAKQGDKILDTHLGSGSIALACHDYGFELTACELDKEYYDAAIKRIKNHVSQIQLPFNESNTER
jgi:site-specific DNA-methyltransferase (adenine-specific)